MGTNSRKNEKILTTIMIAYCIFQVVHYLMYLINYKWGTVFRIFAVNFLRKLDVLDVMRINFPFWWLVPLFVFSLVGTSLYFIWRVIKQ